MFTLSSCKLHDRRPQTHDRSEPINPTSQPILPLEVPHQSFNLVLTNLTTFTRPVFQLEDPVIGHRDHVASRYRNHKERPCRRDGITDTLSRLRVREHGIKCGVDEDRGWEDGFTVAEIVDDLSEREGWRGIDLGDDGGREEDGVGEYRGGCGQGERWREQCDDFDDVGCE